MRDKEIDHQVTVDGVKQMVRIVARECSSCGEILIPGPELDRVIAEIRAADTYSGKLNVRMPPTLHKVIADMARVHGRSLNQEIVEILEEKAKKAANS